MKLMLSWSSVLATLIAVLPAMGAEQAIDANKTAPALAKYFPPPETQGGWRSLLPEKGDPDSERKAKIREVAGVDWDKLEKAWEHNAAAPGATGLLVIRRGSIVGEWYRDADRDTKFLIYSSSKSYTSVAFGLLLADSAAGKLPGGKTLTLDTKVCNAEWIPEALPLPDPRKAEITVRNLLNMVSGIGPEAVPKMQPFEWALGHVKGAPTETLKGDPGTVFNYSNAGVAHLVLLFNHAAGRDLYPFLKERVFDPIGLQNAHWDTIGGDGSIGPYNQGYSGVHTTPREHARFCHLALHRGDWDGKQVVPASYYDFAWQGTKIKPEYGAQWWVHPRIPDAPRDLVQTAGARNNSGYVVPSLDLVIVRFGVGEKYPKTFERDLVGKVIEAVEK
jgi:CubicO group peptidase (beta-lactamase class C family)